MKFRKLVLFTWFAMSVSLGSLLFNLPAERRNSIRELEKISTKIIKEKCSLLFDSKYFAKIHEYIDKLALGGRLVKL